MDEIDFYSDDVLKHVASRLRVGEVVRICDENGKQIATAEVVETHDGGATLTTLSNGG